MQSLLLIILTEEDIAHTGEDSCVVGQFGEDDLVPLQGLFGPSDDLVDVGDLEDGFGDGDDGLYLL